MNLYVLHTGYFKLDGGAMFGVVPKTIWNKLNPADENNLCTWALRCLLIEDGDRLILIDTGLGDKQSEKFFSYYYRSETKTLAEALRQHGFQPEDVTDVILTHLHFDHCGGAINREDDKLVTAFKNATYWSSEEHWEWASKPNPRERASFLKENFYPIKEQGQLKMVNVPQPSTVKLPETRFTDTISLRFVNGHTKAQMLPQLSYKNKTIVFMADLMPSSAHIPLPYVLAFDMFPLISIQEKDMFLKEALKNDYILFFEHDPFYECCNLQQTQKGIRAKDFFKLSEIS